MSSPASKLIVAAILSLTLGGAARAGYIVNMTESGGDVVAIGSGALNLDGLTAASQWNLNAGWDQIVPFAGWAFFGTGESTAVGYEGISSYPGSFGTGGYEPADSGTGVSIIGIWTGNVVVPTGYTSGEALSSYNVWAGQTFASLGVTPGTYTWTWGTGATADFFTMNISAASVPEPSTIVAAGIGLGFVALVDLSRRRHATRT